MKKIYLIILGLWMLLLCATKNPYNSFGRLTGIGLVVNNTVSLNTHEDKIRDKLEYGGCTVTLIDTSALDDSLYNGISEWDDLNVIIICKGTYTDSTAAPDTTKAHGIGKVNLICMDPAFWTDLGLPDSTGTFTDDSVKIQDNSFFPDSIWNVHDLIELYSSDRTMFKLDGVGGDSTNWYITRTTDTDTVVYYKDFSNAKRVAWGMWDVLYYTVDDDEGGYTLLNRMVAYLYGNNVDSVFNVALVLNTLPNAGPLDYLQLNGHTVDTLRPTASSMTTSNLTNVDLIWTYYEVNLPVALTDSLMRSATPLMLNYYAYAGYGISGSASDDSIIIIGDNHQALNGYTNNSYYQVTTTDKSQKYYQTIYEDSVYALFDNKNSTLAIAIAKKNRKELFCGLMNYDYFTITAFDLISQFAGWLMDDEPLQPDSVTITAISEDSMSISWGDQDTSSTQTYAVKIIYPDTMWWTTTLGTTSTCDTIIGMMPNYELQADVYIIEGTDTLCSLNDPDTAYSLANTPASPIFWGLSDTSLTFTLNGYWLEDNFGDTTLATGTVWTETNGGFEVIERYWTMMSLYGAASGGGADTNVISTPYDCDGTFSNYINKDIVWNTNFRFSDSLGLWNAIYFEFYVMADSLNLCPYPAYTYPDGYWLRVEPHYQDIKKGKIELYRMNSLGSTELLKMDSTWSDPTATDNPVGFKWNNLKIVRDWQGTPIDTTIRWSVVLNEDSLFHYNEINMDSVVFNQDGIILATNCWGIYFDNIWIKSITPGSNHSLTDYALQDSVNNVYVDWTAVPDTLKTATEVWGTYSEFGGVKDTLTGLDAFTTYYFRLKARNGR